MPKVKDSGSLSTAQAKCETFGVARDRPERPSARALLAQQPVLARQGIMHLDVLDLTTDAGAATDLRLMKLPPGGVHLVAVLVPPGDAQP